MKTQVELIQAIAKAIDEALNPGPEKTNGYMLIVMPFDAPDGASTNYASNCRREDIAPALKEMAAYFEGQPAIRGHA